MRPCKGSIWPGQAYVRAALCSVCPQPHSSPWGHCSCVPIPHQGQPSLGEAKSERFPCGLSGSRPSLSLPLAQGDSLLQGNSKPRSQDRHARGPCGSRLELGSTPRWPDPALTEALSIDTFSTFRGLQRSLDQWLKPGPNKKPRQRPG